MKNSIYPIIAVALFFISASYSLLTQEYKIKDGYTIQFQSKDPTGTFDVNGAIKFDENDLDGSRFDLKFPVSSINTGNTMKNKKALTSEWFEANKYPNIEFVSTKIYKNGSAYTVVGNLKMHGITKEYKVPLNVDKNGSDLVFSGKFQVNRIEFKVGKRSQAVPDIMNINYSIPVSKK